MPAKKIELYWHFGYTPTEDQLEEIAKAAGISGGIFGHRMPHWSISSGGLTLSVSRKKSNPEEYANGKLIAELDRRARRS